MKKFARDEPVTLVCWRHFCIAVVVLGLSGCIGLGGENHVMSYTAGVESTDPFVGEHTFKIEATPTAGDRDELRMTAFMLKRHSA